MYASNNSIVITKTKFESKKIPLSFDGFKIVQLSDLHNKKFGSNQEVLIKKVLKTEPDLIVFTGDLIDSRKYDEKPSLILIEELVQIAPVYFVTGNHEWKSGKYEVLEGKLKESGVQVLRNEAVEITHKNDKINILGIDDPTIVNDSYDEKASTEAAINQSIYSLEKGGFNILLSHRPEMFSLYKQNKIDLVFSGHAHGGQVRLPFIGGLIAPNQGFFPKFTSGTHTSENTTMIVNRGLGNSIIPLRIFNRPEIVVVTLTSSSNGE